MGDERIESRVRAAGGEGIGKTADTKTQDDGPVYQATGAVKEAYEKTMDAAAESVETVKDAAVAGHDYLRKSMEAIPTDHPDSARYWACDRICGPPAATTT